MNARVRHRTSLLKPRSHISCRTFLGTYSTEVFPSASGSPFPPEGVLHPSEGPILSRAVVGLATRRLTLILRQRLSKPSARHADQTFPASSRKSLPFQRLLSLLTLRPEGLQPSSSLSQCSPGCFPLADPSQARRLVAPSRCSHFQVRRPFSAHPQGMSSAKVRRLPSLQAGSSGPIPSQALIPHLWSSSGTAWDFFTLLVEHP